MHSCQYFNGRFLSVDYQSLAGWGQAFKETACRVQAPEQWAGRYKWQPGNQKHLDDWIISLPLFRV
jgi:hypothetical protein